MAASRTPDSQSVIIYVKLIDEVVDVWRPVVAVPLGDSLYRILPEGFEPDIETWEFEPGEVVRVAIREDWDRGQLVAVSRVAAA